MLKKNVGHFPASLNPIFIYKWKENIEKATWLHVCEKLCNVARQIKLAACVFFLKKNFPQGNFLLTSKISIIWNLNYLLPIWIHCFPITLNKELICGLFLCRTICIWAIVLFKLFNRQMKILLNPKTCLTWLKFTDKIQREHRKQTPSVDGKKLRITPGSLHSPKTDNSAEALLFSSL